MMNVEEVMRSVVVRGQGTDEMRFQIILFAFYEMYRDNDIYV